MNKTGFIPTSVSENHIRAFLNNLGGLQKDAGLPVVLDYDKSNERVRITDKGFILWRKAQKKDDIREMIYDTNDLY
jgi:hypothetical protein